MKNAMDALSKIWAIRRDDQSNLAHKNYKRSYVNDLDNTKRSHIASRRSYCKYLLANFHNIATYAIQRKKINVGKLQSGKTSTG